MTSWPRPSSKAVAVPLVAKSTCQCARTRQLASLCARVHCSPCTGVCRQSSSDRSVCLTLATDGFATRALGGLSGRAGVVAGEFELLHRAVHAREDCVQLNVCLSISCSLRIGRRGRVKRRRRGPLRCAVNMPAKGGAAPRSSAGARRSSTRPSRFMAASGSGRWRVVWSASTVSPAARWPADAAPALPRERACGPSPQRGGCTLPECGSLPLALGLGDGYVQCLRARCSRQRASCCRDTALTV